MLIMSSKKQWQSSRGEINGNEGKKQQMKPKKINSRLSNWSENAYQNDIIAQFKTFKILPLSLQHCLKTFITGPLHSYLFGIKPIIIIPSRTNSSKEQEEITVYESGSIGRN